jgi:hypothetical protein
MAMEIQITRPAGYAMTIKTPAEAVGQPLATNRKGAPAPVCEVSGYTGRPNPARKKNLSFNPAFAQVWVEIVSV